MTAAETARILVDSRETFQKAQGFALEFTPAVAERLDTFMRQLPRSSREAEAVALRHDDRLRRGALVDGGEPRTRVALAALGRLPDA